jgi:hypothetical protein
VSVHRYPLQTLMGDYIKSGLGVLTILVLLIYLASGPVSAITLLLIGGFCLFYLLRTIDRNRAVVSFDDAAITLTSFRSTSVRWADLARMTLAYYAIKRDKSDAWMELTLKDAQATIKLDSRLENFGAIVIKAARVARERRIPLNQITLSNLKALKITGE